MRSPPRTPSVLPAPLLCRSPCDPHHIGVCIYVPDSARPHLDPFTGDEGLQQQKLGGLPHVPPPDPARSTTRPDQATREPERRHQGLLPRHRSWIQVLTNHQHPHRCPQKKKAKSPTTKKTKEWTPSLSHLAISIHTSRQESARPDQATRELERRHQGLLPRFHRGPLPRHRSWIHVLADH
ncbi:hypothetical protein BDA96_06G086700 [Sorghum bicolor]|uniref:Uncharacterized protein n=2 Tax=Sorghum bicolor TaxID=4558 RepID=A0A921QQ26_SORBI|nr:hypothetical protein BDA96_06G086700 [Sorghum bicolor]KXG26301.1 hypothetical protein SORBI_3006G078800 [Sorghum bicolor]